MLLLLPLIYFVLLAGYFYSKHRCLNLDISATLILIAVSVFSVVINIYDVYGDYGINQYSVTLPTVILYCIQWTLVLLPLHYLSSIKIQQHESHKSFLLYTLCGICIFSSAVMILTSLKDIRDALIMDMVDVYNQNAALRSMGGQSESNYLMFLPQIFITTPFPTMLLFFWFYLKTFSKGNLLLRIGLLGASIVQAVLSIIVAGRAALVYWIFDFFLLFGYFYQYLSPKIKRAVSIASVIIGGLVMTQMLIVTLSRFDGEFRTDKEVDPLVSLYAYAGQHVNNFCTMFVEGDNSPTQIGRIFPLTDRIVNHHSFDLLEHYDNISAKTNALVNVFDTFGAEIYLDLGWFGYLSFFILYGFIALVIKRNWQELTFHRVFVLVILLAFFTRGVFAWPFVGHYTTFALAAFVSLYFMFKYTYKV